MEITKNRLYNLIMQEADRVVNRSVDVEQMKFKLSSLPANVLRAVEEFEKEDSKMCAVR